MLIFPPDSRMFSVMTRRVHFKATCDHFQLLNLSPPAWLESVGSRGSPQGQGLSFHYPTVSLAKDTGYSSKNWISTGSGRHSGDDLTLLPTQGPRESEAQQERAVLDLLLPLVISTAIPGPKGICIKVQGGQRGSLTRIQVSIMEKSSGKMMGGGVRKNILHRISLENGLNIH